MDENRELGWNDEIEQDSNDFEVLPEGDYDFEVIKFDRGRSKGSDKLPACNMAILTIKVSDGVKSTTVTENLVLHTKMEWKLSQFFCSIGQKKKGERVQMNWQAVYGAKGRCKLGVRAYKKKDDKPGEETGRANEIVKFYEAENSAPAKRYTAGEF